MNEKYMKMAIKEAKKALLKNEMPVGAVIVYENKVISRGHNMRETNKDSTLHAEIVAIRKACKKIGDWRLNKCLMYVTMEPCLMCMGALIESRIDKIVCGIRNTKFRKTNDEIIKKYNINIEYGIFDNEIKKELQKFFKYIRNK